MDVYIFGNGFIARQLALEAKSRGDTVCVIARTPKLGDLSLQKSEINVHYCNSLTDFTQLIRFFPEKPSYFVLAVGIASPQKFEIENVDEDKNRLIDIFRDIARKLSKYPETRVGYISSGGTIYGDSNAINSELSLCEPKTAYGRFHLEIEGLLSNYLGEQLVLLRLANPYGEEQVNRHQQGLIAYAYNQISNEQPVQLFGNGEQIRDFININDAARVINSALRLIQLPKILNVGTGVGTSNLDVANMVAKVLNKQFQPSLVNSRDFDIKYNVLNMDLARSLGIDVPEPISINQLTYLLRKNELR